MSDKWQQITDAFVSVTFEMFLFMDSHWTWLHHHHHHFQYETYWDLLRILKTDSFHHFKGFPKLIFFWS
jgi:hypothetical protein